MNALNNPYSGKVIIVAIKKGGTGKSLLSMNIAPEIDPDIFYDTDTTPAVTTFNSFRDKQWNVVRLTDDMDNVVDRFIAEVLDAKEKGLSVLVDCGGFDSSLTRAAVAMADLILSPLNDDPSDILGLHEFSKVLEEISAELDVKKTAHVVMNKVHASRRNFTDIDSYISQFDNLKRMDTAIPMDKAAPLKFGMGLGVVEHVSTRYSNSGNAMRSLFLDMRNAIENA
ncbi:MULTISPECIES: ParA family protein [unclassified Pantoea]|uniref:ParA family protein n=1 Tax=unclassified Pantoea TaxID=2630326 RepID=UPI00301BD03A